MMKKIIIIIVSTLFVVLTMEKCGKDDSDKSGIDFSNIENLYAQPLPVIQKCVEGKWKWIEIGTWGVTGPYRPKNTVVDITKDRIVITGDDVLNQTFSYSWKKEGISSNYTTYVMWNNEQDSGEWYFDRIQNDTLFALSYKANPGGYNDSYLFLRIK